MKRPYSPLAVAVSSLVALALAGCGGSSGGSPPATSPAAVRSSDRASAATGDIPDNQVFLTFADRGAGYAIRYPEGWSRLGSGAAVTFRDKDNEIRVVLARGPAPTVASADAALTRLKAAEPSLRVTSAPRAVTLAHGHALKAAYTVVGPPDAVTGKRPLLLVDRYLYAHAGKVATVDLATPKGVDNVDAYRTIARSFAWR